MIYCIITGSFWNYNYIILYRTNVAVELDDDGNVLRYEHAIEEEIEEPEMEKVKEASGKAEWIPIWS